MEFGKIISKVETLLIESYSKKSFKSHMTEFRKNILENKNLSKIYFLYSELSSTKGMKSEIVDDYINESFTILETLIKKESKKIKEVDEWVNKNLQSESINFYYDIDNVIYNKSLKNLENVLESKNNIKRLLKENKKEITISESMNIPLSSMLKIATNTFNSEYNEVLSEEEKEELKSLLIMSKNDVIKQIEESKINVLSKLTNTLNESKNDEELSEKLTKTIERIKETDNSLTSLYKLKQLEKGLN
jgi:DNA-binding protein YbaB